MGKFLCGGMYSSSRRRTHLPGTLPSGGVSPASEARWSSVLPTPSPTTAAGSYIREGGEACLARAVWAIVLVVFGFGLDTGTFHRNSFLDAAPWGGWPGDGMRVRCTGKQGPSNLRM